MYNADDFNERQMHEFEREFKEEFNMALSQIQFDVDESGDIDQQEKAGGRLGQYHFSRG